MYDPIQDGCDRHGDLRCRQRTGKKENYLKGLKNPRLPLEEKGEET
jgi:hypothetical protein